MLGSAKKLVLDTPSSEVDAKVRRGVKQEKRKAVQQLSSGKAPGTDAIPAEVYEAGVYPWQRN